MRTQAEHYSDRRFRRRWHLEDSYQMAACTECDRLLQELIAASKTYGVLVLEMSEAANGERSEYRSVRRKADLAEAEVGRARARYLQHRKDHDR